MAGFSIDVDIAEVQNALKGTSKSLKSIQYGMLRIVARGVVKAIKSGIKSSGLKKRTGELLKCYGYKVRKDGSEVNVFPKGTSGSKIFPKVYTLNYGLDGTNHKPYAFIEKGDTYSTSNKYEEDINKYVEKELVKYWG